MTYLRNRYYDSGTGRFTQLDPIGLGGGLNLYGFASGDPVNFSDPFGLCPPRDENRADCTVILNGATLSNPSFVKTLTTFAQYVGRDIVLNGECSGDRTAECQQRFRGAPGSAHTSNEGADIHAAGYSNLDLAQLASESGLFTGVGYYEGSAKTKHGPHAHVDTKSRRAKWWEDTEGTTRPGLPPKPEDQ